MDEKTRTELEAATFRRLIKHFQHRTDVQNIDLMGYGGFCRNCLSKWMKEEADTMGLALDPEAAREAIYGMPYDEYKSKHQTPATDAQLKLMDESIAKNDH